MGEHGPRVDHVIIAARDLKEAAAHIYQEYGLAAYEGGRHQGWGTENYIVPLNGEGYLEIAAVFDEAVALKCDWGKLILEKAASRKPWTLVAFCVETPEGALKTSERLQADSAPMLRLRPDGTRLTWQVGAMSVFSQDRGPKPFFITWDDPSIRPDRIPAAHKVQPTSIKVLELAGDQEAMAQWVGPQYIDGLPLVWSAGSPGIISVKIALANGETITLQTP